MNISEVQLDRQADYLKSGQLYVQEIRSAEIQGERTRNHEKCNFKQGGVNIMTEAKTTGANTSQKEKASKKTVEPAYSAEELSNAAVGLEHARSA